MHKLELRPIEGCGHGYNLSVDGHKIRATGMRMGIEAGCVPYATIDIGVTPELELMAEIGLKIKLSSVEDAVGVIKHALTTDSDVYNGFAASIKSALDDIEGSMNHEDTAKVILDRIVGKE